MAVPAGSEEVTIGELSRTIARMDLRVATQFEAVNRRLDSLQFVHRETYSVQMAALVDRLEALEEAKRWTVRTFVASFTFPILVGAIVMQAVAR